MQRRPQSGADVGKGARQQRTVLWTEWILVYVGVFGREPWKVMLHEMIRVDPLDSISNVIF